MTAILSLSSFFCFSQLAFHVLNGFFPPCLHHSLWSSYGTFPWMFYNKSGPGNMIIGNIGWILLTALNFRAISFAVKSRQNDIKDILNNVDSEGSTLLHLAVDSGNSEVSTSLAAKSIAFSPLGNVLYSSLSQAWGKEKSVSPMGNHTPDLQISRRYQWLTFALTML